MFTKLKFPLYKVTHGRLLVLIVALGLTARLDSCSQD